MIKALEPGVILQKRYEILSLIGTGGSGFVYRVAGVMLKKELALKELYDTSVNSDDKKRIAVQFITEARTLSKLCHRGIPKVYDAFVDDDRYYIAMELVRGTSLDTMLKKEEGFPGEAVVREWMGQSLEILAYLHNLPEQVIVRDIKPTNIMLTPEGTLMFIDFGIAKIFNPQTGTNQYIKGSGSDRFAPPEQYGTGSTDPRSDIYALGVTFYYMLTGSLVPNSIDRVLEQAEVILPSRINPRLSAQLETILMKMIEISPQDRFQCVEEIQQALAVQPPVEEIPQALAVQSPVEEIPQAQAVQPPVEEIPQAQAVQPPVEEIPHSPAGMSPAAETQRSHGDAGSPAVAEATGKEAGIPAACTGTPAGIVLPLVYCPQCGSRFSASDQFCSKCGRRRFKR